MDCKRQDSAGFEGNTAELLPRNPYCSNEGTHCGCRLSPVAFQPQWVAAKPWSLWKTFLVCLLACLIATTLVVLVVYFVHFSKPTVIIHADGKSSYAACIPGSTPSPALSPAPSSTPSPTPSPTPPPTSSPTPFPAQSTWRGSQSTLPSSPVTTVPPSPMKTTAEHEVSIEDP